MDYVLRIETDKSQWYYQDLDHVKTLEEGRLVIDELWVGKAIGIDDGGKGIVSFNLNYVRSLSLVTKESKERADEAKKRIMNTMSGIKR